ncbi:MAG TPA: hypothetical protein VMU16_06075 [Candidatus Binataceae bacterium]|nr:hypothetical protein [Candidatus Binataceae bacterium]
MFKRLLRWRMDKFERDFNYDMSYAREIAEYCPGAMLKINAVSGLAAYRRDLPLDVFHAAHIATALAEDCGPCTQLCVTMAEREGVKPATIRAILARDETAMPPEIALAVRFTRAVYNRDLRADEFREEIVKLYGKRGLVSLAISMSAGRFFPFAKYALGYGHACSRVVVGGAETVVPKHAA